MAAAQDDVGDVVARHLAGLAHAEVVGIEDALDAMGGDRDFPGPELRAVVRTLAQRFIA